jgi:hypothetical protein
MNMPKQFSKRWKTVREQALAALAAWALVLAPAAVAAQEKSQGQKTATTSQTPAPVSKPSANAESNAAKSERSGGPQEGIKVHGRWVIEVRNPDGALVTHRAFENSYAPSGNVLPALLSRNGSIGSWEVTVYMGNSSILIGEPALQVPNGNLAVTAASGSGQVVLTGNAPAPSSGSISDVQTGVHMCAPSTSPANCNTIAGLIGSTGLTFTTAHLATPIAVSANQIVQVTVTISFS